MTQPTTHIDIEKFPRVELCHRPTPLEPMPRLTKYLGGPRLFVKRDDCTGLAIGGNKTRKLEFLLGDAIEQNADTVITVGGVQSNHARQTAAAAAKLGLKCHLVLPRVVDWQSDDYESSGNVLLDRLFDAHVHVVDDTEKAREKVTELVAAADGSAYFIPSGGSTAIGSLGYVGAALEIAKQTEAMDLQVDHIVLATSTGGTQAGLLTGFAGSDAHPAVHGIAVYGDAETAMDEVQRLVVESADLLNTNVESASDRVVVLDGYLGKGYGWPTADMIEAVSLTARLEGLLLDPVYTGKAMAGLIDMVRKEKFKESENIVFLMTGGTPALFPYREALIRD